VESAAGCVEADNVHSSVGHNGVGRQDVGHAVDSGVGLSITIDNLRLINSVP